MCNEKNGNELKMPPRVKYVGRKMKNICRCRI